MAKSKYLTGPSESGREMLNKKLNAFEGMGVFDAMEESKRRTAMLTGEDYEPTNREQVDTSGGMSTKDKINAFSNAASALKAGQDSNSEGASALQGAGMGASAGAAFGPWGAVIGAGIGALSGIMNARANAQKNREENERARATALAQNITNAGTAQQNAMTNMMDSLNRALIPGKRT